MKKKYWIIVLLIVTLSFFVKPVNAISPLHIDGRYIKDDLGNIVYLRGVQIGPDFCDSCTAYWMFIDGWNPDRAAQHLDVVKSWGGNVIRMHAAIDCWKSNRDNHRQIIKELLELLAERDMYLVYDFYSLLTGLRSHPCPNFDTSRLPYPPYQCTSIDNDLLNVIPDESAFVDVWRSVAQELKDYPNIIFELWNEPHPALDPYSVAGRSWHTVAQDCINAIREEGAEQIVIFQWRYGTHPDWGKIDWIDAFPFNDPEPANYLGTRSWAPNILYSTHIYRWHGQLGDLGVYCGPGTYTYEEVNATLNQILLHDYAATMPIFIGETGCAVTCPDTTPNSANMMEHEAWKNLLDIYHELGIHYTAFWFRPELIFQLISDVSFTPRPSGQVLIDHLKETLEYLVNITGTVTNSETGSPIQGARVTCNAFSGTTDDVGTYFIRMTTPAPGSCDLTASRTGYATKSTSFTFNDNMTYTGRNFALDPVSLNSLYGRLIDINNNPVQATIIAYQQGTIVDSISTDSSGNYNLLIAPGTYDIQFNLINFYIPNYYIKIPSVDITADVYDLIEHITGYPTDNKVSIIMDIDESQTIQTYSNVKPTRVSQNGTNLTEVYSLLELGDNKWFYEDSISKKLHLVATPSIAAPVCGDGNLDTGEECGEPGLPACPTDYTCINCRCVSTIISKLHTEGAHLVNEQGEQVHLHGVCKNDFIEDPWGGWGGEAGAIAHLDAIKSWGGNFIALGVLTEDYLAPNSAVRNNYKRVVQLAYERGIYVGVGAFGAYGTWPSPCWANCAGQHWINNPQSYIDFWLAVSNDFKNTPNVIYGSLAEVGFGEGTNHFSVGDEALMDQYFAVVVQAVQELRANGDEHVFIYHEGSCHCPARLDKPATEGGEVLRKIHEQPLDPSNPTGPKLTNVGYDAHAYRVFGTFGTSPYEFTPASAPDLNRNGAIPKDIIQQALEYYGWLKILNEYNVPIVMWEGGACLGDCTGDGVTNIQPPNSFDNELASWRNALELFHDLDVGYGAFWWNPSMGWALINYPDLSPTDWGQVLIDVLANVSPACECSAWVNQGCGLAGCSNDEKYQTRTCLPEDCGITSRCIYDVSCVDTCLDGTPYEECNTNGYYCDNGSLIAACGPPYNCGCPSGKSCNETTNECYTIPGEYRTFGKTDIGGTSWTQYTSFNKFGCRFQAPENGIIKNISYYGRGDKAQSCHLAVYSDNNGAPYALLGSDSFNIETTVGWYNVSGLSISITSGNYYWFVLNNGGFGVYIYYDSGDANQFVNGLHNSDPPPPSDPFGTYFYEDWNMSIYATYT